MAFLVTDLGEEFETTSVWKPGAFTKPGSVDVGLYLDATDQITDTDDVSDISTEPGGGSYSRQSVSIDSGDITLNDNANGNWEVQFKDLTWDMSDSSQNVDGYFVVASFKAQDTGDGSANDHLIFTGQLSQEFDGSQLGSTFKVTDTGRSAD